MKTCNSRVPPINGEEENGWSDVRPFDRGLQYYSRNRDCTDLDVAVHIVLDD